MVPARRLLDNWGSGGSIKRAEGFGSRNNSPAGTYTYGTLLHWGRGVSPPGEGWDQESIMPILQRESWLSQMRHCEGLHKQKRFYKGRAVWQLCHLPTAVLTWDQALFSFRFENYIPAGKTKRKESLIQTFNEMSAAHFFDWLTFAESANQNYFRCLFF